MLIKDHFCISLELLRLHSNILHTRISIKLQLVVSRMKIHVQKTEKLLCAL